MPEYQNSNTKFPLQRKALAVRVYGEGFNFYAVLCELWVAG